MFRWPLMAALLAATAPRAAAQETETPRSYLEDPGDCQGPMEAWDVGSAMCMPIPVAGMPMQMTMVHGNAFGTWITESGPRGRRAFAAPDMLMLDAGRSVGDWQYVNVDLMGTAELWTFPQAGSARRIALACRSSTPSIPIARR